MGRPCAGRQEIRRKKMTGEMMVETRDAMMIGERMIQEGMIGAVMLEMTEEMIGETTGGTTEETTEEMMVETIGVKMTGDGMIEETIKGVMAETIEKMITR